MATRTGGALALPVLVLSAGMLAACAAPSSEFALPPAGAAFDYQLGGAYPPPPGVEVVARDRTAAAADGLYSICYVNGFQTQPGERDQWPEELLLHAGDGDPVIDPDWPDEVLLDTSTAAHRAAIVEIVEPWIQGCAADGFDAVEFDNLDTFTRSGGALTLDGNASLAADLVRVAHEAGLAAGQKNAAEHAAALREAAAFDFAVAEECAAFDECGSYRDVYGAHVLDIEYTDALPRSFPEMCADPDVPGSVVLRDRPLSTPDDPQYVYERCQRVDHQAHATSTG